MKIKIKNPTLEISKPHRRVLRKIDNEFDYFKKELYEQVPDVTVDIIQMQLLKQPQEHEQEEEQG